MRQLRPGVLVPRSTSTAETRLAFINKWAVKIDFPSLKGTSFTNIVCHMETIHCTGWAASVECSHYKHTALTPVGVVTVKPQLSTESLPLTWDSVSVLGSYMLTIPLYMESTLLLSQPPVNYWWGGGGKEKFCCKVSTVVDHVLKAGNASFTTSSKCLLSHQGRY